MEIRTLSSTLQLVGAMAISCCAAAEASSPSHGQSYAGWYTERSGKGSFQPCESTTALSVSQSGELRARAKRFGLDEDTPVYVRLSGVVSAGRNEFSLVRIEQFGSPNPVRDCPMTGLQIQSSAPSAKPVAEQDIGPGAADAVRVVDAFSAAIKAARLKDAGDLLDPEVLILESGSSERSRDQYLEGHAIADSAFMQNAQMQLRYRRARVSGNLAWVASEGLLQMTREGKPTAMLSTETMLLGKGARGWKIVHIHWSSRPAPKN